MVAEAAGDPERQQQPVQLLIDWDKIKGGLPSPKTPYCSSWSMAAIKSNNNNDNDNDNPPIVFPPINHENLHISPHTPPILPRTIHTHQKPHFSFSGSDSDSDSNYSSSSSLATTFSPSDSSPVLPRSPICPRSTPPSSSSGWFDAWAGILRSKLNALLVRCCSSSPGVLSTFRSAAFAAVLIAFLYLRRRRARRRLSVGGDERRDQDRLIAIIKDRDEKINQLLDQLSRMNQMLLALHKLPARPIP